ncbi:MAG: OmpA family protein [Candidatus Cloacimonadaceae bacterium]|nr:OmpA family protein [Candidatus Cloacimonadaceae bacterium]
MISESRHELNYWPSFVDIFASLFFVFLILFAAFYTGVRNTSQIIENDLKEFKDMINNSNLKIKPDTLNFNLTIDESVLFTTGQSALKTDGTKVAEKLGKSFDRYMTKNKRYGKYSIIIEGHTDTKAGDDINDPLSLARANALISEMRKWINLTVRDSIEFIPVGFGEHKLFKPTEDEVNEQANRRVEIRIIPKFDETIKDVWKKLNKE